MRVVRIEFQTRERDSEAWEPGESTLLCEHDATDGLQWFKEQVLSGCGAYRLTGVTTVCVLDNVSPDVGLRLVREAGLCAEEPAPPDDRLAQAVLNMP